MSGESQADSRDACHFWESRTGTCHFEVLVLGCEPCADCPADPRSLIQGFARARRAAFPDGCPWGKPPGCRCANCYTG